MGPRSAGQLQSMFSSGMQRCTLKSLGLTSLYGIGVQYEVKRIYLQQNLLTSFEGWEYQPDLVELNAEDNRIENFRGACEQRNLEDVRLRGNPIADLQHYRTMVLIAFGKLGIHGGLRMIDGIAVKKSEIEVAGSLSKLISGALREGWILDTVANPNAVLDFTLHDYLRMKKKNGAEFALVAQNCNDEAATLDCDSIRKRFCIQDYAGDASSRTRKGSDADSWVQDSQAAAARPHVPSTGTALPDWRSQHLESPADVRVYGGDLLVSHEASAPESASSCGRHGYDALSNSVSRRILLLLRGRSLLQSDLRAARAQACGANPDHYVVDYKGPESVGEASGSWADVGRRDAELAARGWCPWNNGGDAAEKYSCGIHSSMARTQAPATQSGGLERRDPVIDTREQQHYRACLEHAYRVVESTPFLRKTIASPPPCKSASIDSQRYDDTDFTDNEEMEERFDTLKNDFCRQCRATSDEDQSLSTHISALNIGGIIRPGVLTSDRCSHVSKHMEILSAVTTSCIDQKSKRDRNPPRKLLSACEIRGNCVVGDKLTAFAKRCHKRLVISCDFQWFSITQDGIERMIPYETTASYIVKTWDIGARLKVVCTPKSESGEQGQQVSAESQLVLSSGLPGPLDTQDVHLETENNPRLLDWKIEIHNQRDYVDPIQLSYVYAGGKEGNTLVSWLRERRRDTNEFEPLIEGAIQYQPYVEDEGRKIKINITPVRADAVAGPTYTYIIDKLNIPASLMAEVNSHLEMIFQGIRVTFPVENPIMLGSRKAIVCTKHYIEIVGADGCIATNFVYGLGLMKVKARRKLPDRFQIKIMNPPAPPVVHEFIAENMRARDVLVILLKRLVVYTPISIPNPE